MRSAPSCTAGRRRLRKTSSRQWLSRCIVDPSNTPWLALAPGPAGLASAVSATLQRNGEEVSNLTCADTAHLAQGIVTVCHGFSGGDPWDAVVVFENRDGQFTVLTAPSCGPPGFAVN